MENNILDEIEKEIEPLKFALKSYQQFLFAFSVLVGFIITAFIFGGSTFSGGILSLFFTIMFLSALGANIVGVINIIKSIRRKERNHWKKYVGGIGNLILFLFFLLMALTLVLDVYNVFIK